MGGGEQLIAALVDAGQALGWEQTVLNPFADTNSIALAERCAAANYEARECSSVLGLPRLRSWLACRLAELQPDIVHVILFHAAVLTASVKRRHERRLLTHMYGEGLAQLAHPRTRARLDRWAGKVRSRIGISDAVHTFLTQSHGYPPPSSRPDPALRERLLEQDGPRGPSLAAGHRSSFQAGAVGESIERYTTTRSFFVLMTGCSRLPTHPRR